MYAKDECYNLNIDIIVYKLIIFGGDKKIKLREKGGERKEEKGKEKAEEKGNNEMERFREERAA